MNVLSRDILNGDKADQQQPLNRLPTDQEWNDEFLKTIGPELERIPLLYASPSQVSLKLQRLHMCYYHYCN